MGKRIKIYTYKGKKGEYKITYINNLPHFVIIKNPTRGKFIDRVNIKKETPYQLYIGDFTQLNDLVII